ncbi:MAG TPA: DciA family protein [Acidothermaceae bacterium]|nr:DciA family protein [Acidothermaceae bacterium]
MSGDEFPEDSERFDPAGGAVADRADGDSAVIRPLSGIDLARAALARSRQEARARGSAVPAKRNKGSRAAVGSARRDAGDPELLGETLSRLLVERGWDVPAAAAGVTERWAEIAGAELADHCRPERFDAGVLNLVAESTAWATQVRMLVPRLHQRIDEVIGSGVVTRIEVRGPSGPDWRRGALRVRGPGPRDTYG